jgi:cytochrome c oxidase cbb3-type subunit I/II
LNNTWHFRHLVNPRDIWAGSNMPPYAFLRDTKVDMNTLADRMRAMQAVGVPYSRAEVDNAVPDAQAQANEIVTSLQADSITVAPDADIVAVIAYLQRLGRKAE